MKAIFLILCLLFAHLSLADSWSPPKTKRYYSPDSSYFVDIVPQHIPTKYYAWRGAKPHKKHRFAATDTIVTPCSAAMFRLQGPDTVKVWEQQLINRVAPLSALVSNDGHYLVTFDNWASVGYGVDVLAVYDEQGLLLKRYTLDEFSPFPLNTYRRSISSLWWMCAARLTAPHQVEICFQNEKKEQKRRSFNLETLQFTP